MTRNVSRRSAIAALGTLMKFAAEVLASMTPTVEPRHRAFETPCLRRGRLFYELRGARFTAW